jgi:hypothetical protein
MKKGLRENFPEKTVPQLQGCPNYLPYIVVRGLPALKRCLTGDTRVLSGENQFLSLVLMKVLMKRANMRVGPLSLIMS